MEENIIPNPNPEEPHIEVYIDTKNEVTELRKILDKVTVSCLYTDDTDEMYKCVDMATQLATIIKYLQSPETVPIHFDFDDLAELDTDEDDD